MGKKNDTIQCSCFMWRIRPRHDNGVYYADGRGYNTIDIGRHSLGTRDRDDAIEILKQLDLRIAIRHGLADASLASDDPPDLLPIPSGVQMYLDWVGRPTVAGGSEAAKKRYKAVFDKFKRFADSEGIQYWQHVTKRVIVAYTAWLDGEGYGYATEYLEGTTIKQCMNTLRDELGIKGLPEFKLGFAKPGESTTYCYRPVEVQAMLERCRQNPKLVWIERVIVALSHTGLRISELAALSWSDLDLEQGMLRLPDRSRHGSRDQREKGRRTKSRRSREFPIHAALRRVLEQMPQSSEGPVFRGLRGAKLKPDVVRTVLLRELITPLRHRFPGSGDGPSFQDGRVHSFRHYFCSMCADSGVPEQLLMNWLGHQDSKMVKRYYHPDRERAVRHMEKIQFVPEDPAAV